MKQDCWPAVSFRVSGQRICAGVLEFNSLTSNVKSYPVFFIAGQFSLSFPPSPPIPLWIDDKYPVFATRRVDMDILHAQFSVLLSSTILSCTIPQAHQLSMSSIFIKITITIYNCMKREISAQYLSSKLE